MSPKDEKQKNKRRSARTLAKDASVDLPEGQDVAETEADAKAEQKKKKSNNNNDKGKRRSATRTSAKGQAGVETDEKNSAGIEMREAQDVAKAERDAEQAHAEANVKIPPSADILGVQDVAMAGGDAEVVRLSKPLAVEASTDESASPPLPQAKLENAASFRIVGHEPLPRETLGIPAAATSDDLEPTPKEAQSRTKGGPVIVILVNSKSGGNAAVELLALPKDGILVNVPGSELQATCFSYAIADPEKEGIKHLSQEVRAARVEPVMCIVAGGDGTVMWAIQQIFNAKIPSDHVILGTIPFGTGNDFSNATKWGNSGPSKGFLQESNDFVGLRKYVQAWLQAGSCPFDIWEVSVQTRASESGQFEFVDNKRKHCTEWHMARHSIKEQPGGRLEMSKYVCNYYSIGLDARVGFGFDKHRQHSQCMNKSVYVWEGFKKLLFKKKGVIGHVVESMCTVRADNLASASEGHDCKVAEDRDVVFSTQAEAPSGAKLVGNPVSLIFLNIPSIAGGLDIWKRSANKLGATGCGDELLKARQDFGDGRLECLSYRTGLGFYREQLRMWPISGQGHRIFSGGGPLRIRFRDPSDSEYKEGTSHCKGRIYMQIDGEYFSVREPESVVVRHHKTIRVLMNVRGD